MTVELCCAKRALLDAVDSTGKSSLIYACFQGHLAAAHFLLQQKAAVNVQDSDGVSALHWASLGGFLELVELLLKHGADVNALEFAESQSTPVDYALINNHEAVANVLVSYSLPSRRE